MVIGETDMTLKIIQVGAGIRGSHWLEFVRDFPDVENVAVVDPDPQAIASAKELVGSDNCGYYESFELAFEERKADAVIIASPSRLHSQHASMALENNLAVMVEKPFALTVDEAQAVIDLSEKVNRPVMVAENYRYKPAERTIRKLVQDNYLGQVHTVTLTDRRFQPASSQGPWVADMPFIQLQEIAIHHFDSLRSFFDCRPLNITTQVYNPSVSDYSHGACTKALIEMEGGIHVTYLGTETSNRYAYSLFIEGEKGDLWTNRKWVLGRNKGARFFMPIKKVKVPAGDEQPYPREGVTSLLNNLRAATLSGKEPETCGKDNIWNVAMVQAAMISVEERRTVDLQELMSAGTEI